MKLPKTRRGHRLQVAPNVRFPSPEPALITLVPEAFGVDTHQSDRLGRSSPEIEAEFVHQASLWKRETRHASSVTKMVSHPSYRRIIGLGRPVLRLLFRELQTRPDHWFVALNEITGVDPVPPSATFSEAVESWLAWGQKKGYLAS